MPYWKFGINYGGMQSPSHYKFIHAEEIAIGREGDTPFNTDDLVAITQGETLLAIVRIKEPRQPITDRPAYEARCLEYGIEFEEATIFAKAEWYVFPIPGWLPIQRGGCEIHNPELTAMIQDIWDAREMGTSANTYLFVWNPKKWDWVDLEEGIGLLASTGKFTQQWSVVSHRKVRPGDRAFLARVGKDPKGIFGAGFVASTPFLSQHWSGEDRDVSRVMIDFDVLINPESEPILTLDELNKGNLVAQSWTPQASGISIKPELVNELEALWFHFLQTNKIRSSPLTPDFNEDQQNYNEGSPIQVTLTRYERNPYARKVCIDHYGYLCSVCSFDFEATYGQLGKEFIHVHHLTQIANVGEEHKVDPIKDLRPVCPNCHAMIHRRKDAYSIDEIKQFIEESN